MVNFSLLSDLLSCPSCAHCTVALYELSFQLVALLRWGIQYIEGDFSCIWFRSFSEQLKAWPPCCSLLPVLSSSQGTPTLPGWPGWSGLRVGQVGNRQGYHLQPPSCTYTAQSTQAPTAHPFTLPISLSRVHTQWFWCAFTRTWRHKRLFQSLTNSRYMSYLFHLSFQPVRSVTDPGWRQSTVELWKVISLHCKARNWDLVTKSYA